jgi:glucokinase
MRFYDDNRIVMTLDAGGTNFVFSAVRAENEIIDPIRYSAKEENIEEILKKLIDGFRQVENQLDDKPAAISFSFPGPADYKNGIIGDLENLPLFRGGVALKAVLENEFNISTFINNDGDLFSYGEAIAGLLPEINTLLKEKGIEKEYRNLLGVTFGTGFGGGIVRNGQLFLGDNSAGGEINRMRNKLYPETSSEDSISIRGLQRVYASEAGIDIGNVPEPKELYDIVLGKGDGDKQAALKAFSGLAVVAGDVMANAVTLLDGIVVIGGGLSGAHPVFLERLVEEMNTNFTTFTGASLSRMEVIAFNLESKNGLEGFLKDTSININVPFSNQNIKYDPVKKIGVGITRLGTSKATAIGAYTYALDHLDKLY